MLKGEENELKNHFLICRDKDETTIITEEKNVLTTKHEKEVKWFKLIEIKVSVPFLTPGFLAKISKTISNQNLNILIVSTFSKDYVLIREEDFEVALNALKDIGFPTTIDT
ncbi:hypothetical protein COV17_00595 [Candidatus Woesearchaeota archaeon CG10_big_fil_rev_8_21_14_0_10_36_11]|nr:MAG: hypothetical protein COV17_00595 [Candidatus Woesearchaeota archaeon CG10_big_fil_rev_8_21_14_0_10_36_11]